ncbi:hypothetical protein J5N97_003964 [Dioscorea zingiberensis]|uniref:Uncharacterized protein n=1 Tax=Dioscorea zingiberensis TaxID=325984 RepID=A0A9D5HQZ2_9LILI|nr:hypothetical protein J5N97_003964 [Dioscorea zingiberensis]
MEAIRDASSAIGILARDDVLYMTDPNGNYGGWKAAAIGRIKKQDYKEEMTWKAAVQLALKVLSKTM